MMNTKTYLIFFGKSQSFTFYAFSEEGYIKDFNSIIRDFDLLESDFFTTDNENNKPILAKYNFKRGCAYSLLKLYSVAQAYDGSRIKGGIYGVALLSENDIKICKENIELLDAAIKEFAKLSLNGIKFNKSDFFNDANNIWIAVKDGNYFHTIKSEGTPKIINAAPQAYYINSLNDSFDLNNKINETSRIYISTDLEHFKRAYSNGGFSFYLKENGKYDLYKEKKPDTGKHEKTGSTSDTRSEDSRKTEKPNGNDISEQSTEAPKEFISKEDFEKFKKWTEKWVKILICTSAVCVIAIITFFFSTSAPLDKWKTILSFGESIPKNTQLATNEIIDDERTTDPIARQGENQRGSGNSSVGGDIGDIGDSSGIAKISIESEAETVEVDKSITLTAKITPNDNGFNWNTKAEWSIDNSNIAKLTTSSKKGKFGKTATITGKTEGKVQVTLTVDGSSIVKEITVKAKSTTHTVKNGDTLVKIATRHRVSVDSIKKWNNLPNDTIAIGQILKIAP